MPLPLIACLSCQEGQPYVFNIHRVWGIVTYHLKVETYRPLPEVSFRVSRDSTGRDVAVWVKATRDEQPVRGPPHFNCASLELFPPHSCGSIVFFSRATPPPPPPLLSPSGRCASKSLFCGDVFNGVLMAISSRTSCCWIGSTTLLKNKNLKLPR